MVLRIVFCDDNEEILSQLHSYVCEFFAQNGGTKPDYALYTSGEALLAHETAADIAFLDVEMPGISGIHVGEALMRNNPRTLVFIVTAFTDYLDEAMRFHVFRYISKPIDKNRLFRNLKDAVYQYNINSKKIPIITMDGIITCESDELICIEAKDRKVTVYTCKGTFQSRETMDEWRKKLTLPCFFETHRSYIINMRFVYMTEKDTVTMRYHDFSLTAYLTKRKYALFKKTFLLYLETVK